MKKFLLLVCLLFAGLTLSADPTSSELLGKLRTKVRGFTSYRIDFTAASQQEGSTRGNILISGHKFRSDVLGQELYYDGTTLWSYSSKDNEVTVETMRSDAPGQSVFSNPSRLLNINPDDYSHEYAGANTVGGKGSHVVVLTPKTKTDLFDTITLYIDPETSLPIRIRFEGGTNTSPLELIINGVKSDLPVTAEMFRFDTGAHKGVEVIDFRK